MKVTSINLKSATALDLEINVSKSVTVLSGTHSDLALDLVREIIGDYNATEDPDRIDDGHFVIHADIELDGKNYSVCYIRNADFIGDNRIAANFRPNSLEFSIDDTHEFSNKINECNVNDSNVFDSNKLSTDIRFSESDRCLKAFELFVKNLTNDDRPIFIYDFFERIDESVDVTNHLNKLASLGRQVFVAVVPNYPLDKLTCTNVQIVEINA